MWQTCASGSSSAEHEVEDLQQRAASEYTTSVRPRLDNDRVLLKRGGDGNSQSWLARVLGWVRAFARCSVSPAQTLTGTHLPLARTIRSQG